MTPGRHPPEGVVITTREIWDELRQVHALVELQLEHLATVRDVQEDHEQRIRAGERLRWPLPSVSALLAVIALAWTVLTKRS